MLNPFPALDSGFQLRFAFQSLLEHLPDICEIGAYDNTMFKITGTSGFLHGIMFSSHCKSSLKISDPGEFLHDTIPQVNGNPSSNIYRPNVYLQFIGNLSLGSCEYREQCHSGMQTA